MTIFEIAGFALFLLFAFLLTKFWDNIVLGFLGITADSSKETAKAAFVEEHEGRSWNHESSIEGPAGTPKHCSVNIQKIDAYSLLISVVEAFETGKRLSPLPFRSRVVLMSGGHPTKLHIEAEVTTEENIRFWRIPIDLKDQKVAEVFQTLRGKKKTDLWSLHFPNEDTETLYVFVLPTNGLNF
jgi:hypothetical protein